MMLVLLHSPYSFVCVLDMHIGSTLTCALYVIYNIMVSVHATDEPSCV